MCEKLRIKKKGLLQLSWGVWWIKQAEKMVIGLKKGNSWEFKGEWWRHVICDAREIYPSI